MSDLFLRKIDHPQARNNYRVILKTETEEISIGSIGLFTGMNSSWTWAIDTVIPMQEVESEGHGIDRKDCTIKFKAAWQKLETDRGRMLEFLEAKRRSATVTGTNTGGRA